MGLPYPIRTDVMMHLHEEICKRVPMFQQADSAFLRALVVRLRSQVILRGDYLFRQGDAGQEMYFVREGQMEVVLQVHNNRSSSSEDSRASGGGTSCGSGAGGGGGGGGGVAAAGATEERVVASLRAGSFFGEISLILEERRTASMRAGSRCDLSSLDKAAFNELLELCVAAITRICDEPSHSPRTPDADEPCHI